jgi:2,4-dienoyl-CoA reductase-like NADH-dependent reductase (Old Yellow Enzyme family)
MKNLFQAMSLKNGSVMRNRFMLAPLTNTQSHEDGRLSDDEYRFLTMRAKGGFGLTMTCASHVQANGKGFSGQLGCFSDDHLPGLTRLADGIRAEGSLAVLQLHHAGMRSPPELIDGQPVCPSDNEKTAARGLEPKEVEQLAERFIDAAVRAETAGFDGVELHGAHGYIIGQFLSADINRRTDRYGGSLENRARLMFDIIDGIRRRCSPGFLLGLRLSPERFGMQLNEVIELTGRLMTEAQIDFLDMSLWDVFKEPEEPGLKGKTLLEHFTALDRGQVRLGVAGKISTARDAQHCLEAGADFVIVGRAAILHHDFPEKIRSNPGFEPVSLPVSAAYLRKEGLGEPFIQYMRRWEGFVIPEPNAS